MNIVVMNLVVMINYFELIFFYIYKMVVEIVIKKSTNKNKKYDAIFNNKKISFGSALYEDYTMHKDDKRKSNYIKRHSANEDWSDYETAGFWARWILWESPTLEEAVKNLNKKFKNINVKLDL
jgi:hypothetical protein